VVLVAVGDEEMLEVGVVLAHGAHVEVGVGAEVDPHILSQLIGGAGAEVLAPQLPRTPARVAHAVDSGDSFGGGGAADGKASRHGLVSSRSGLLAWAPVGLRGLWHSALGGPWTGLPGRRNAVLLL